MITSKKKYILLIIILELPVHIINFKNLIIILKKNIYLYFYKKYIIKFYYKILL